MRSKSAATALTIWIAGAACTPSPADAPRSDRAAASTASSAEWTWSPPPNVAVRHRSGARFFAYTGPRDLDRGFAGIVEDEGRGPAYGLLGGYFAPRLMATGSSSTAVVRADGRQLYLELPGLRVHVAPPQNNRLRFRLTGGGTFAFPADRTDVQGLLNSRPSFAVNVSAGAEPGYRAWRADELFVRTRSGAVHQITTDCPQILLIHPVPRGSTSVFLLHLGPLPPPRDTVYVPPAPVPSAALSVLSQCPPSSTSTLTVTLP